MSCGQVLLAPSMSRSNGRNRSMLISDSYHGYTGGEGSIS